MSDGRWIAELADAHRDSYPMGNIHHGTEERPDWGTFCVECKQSWPCDVSRLLDALAEHPATPAEEVAEVAVEEREALADEVFRRLDPQGYGWAAGDGPSAEEVIAAALASDWLRDHIAALTAKAKAEERERIAAAIAGSVSPGFGINHDGTEDSHAMAYVEGLKDAHDIAKEPR